MPRFYPTTCVSDCFGTAGNITFYHREGKCYWRKRSQNTYIGSPAQLQQQEVHRRALAAWRLQPEYIKELWREYAMKAEPHKPPFDHTSHITGHNLFVSAYHGFALLGDEIVPEPKAFVPFPDFFASFLSASKSGGMLQLRFKLSVNGTEEPQRYRLLCKVQVCEAGRGCHPGKMRNHLAEPVADDVAAVSVVVPPELESKTEVQCHIRYLLIDTITGYRSNYRKLSFVASLT